MELTATQLDGLNSKLPPGFLLEPLEPMEIKHRRSELEQLELSAKFVIEMPSRAPKQRQRETFSAKPSKLQVSEGFRKLFLIISKLKKHPRVHIISANSTPALTLEIIEGRLLREEYENGLQFAEDVRKLFSDARETLPSAESNEQILELQKYFETLMHGHEHILLTLRKQQRMEEAPSPSPKSLDEMQLQILMGKIRGLEPKYLKGICSIVRNSDEIEGDGETLKRDILKLELSVVKGLVQHVDTCLQKSKLLPKPVMTPQPATSLAMPPVLLNGEPCPAKDSKLRMGQLAPINAPIRQELAGFHDILPRIIR